MFRFQQAGVASIMLVMLNNVSAENSNTGGNTLGMGPSSTIVDCVLRDPAQGKLLQQIDAAKQLYTHRCTGGIYLIDRDLDPEGKLGSAVPVVQGWWLDSIIGVHQPDKQSIVVDRRFITGVGPNGSQLFRARIRLNWVGEAWQVEEPFLLK